MTCAVILAGGLGTRLRSMVADVPKPMALINGRPFLEYQIDYWIGQGIDRAILSVGYRHDAILSHFGKDYGGIPIEYAIEENPLGTGGGLLQALAMLDDARPILVLNGDSFVESSLANLMQIHESRQSEWTMVLVKSDKGGRYMGVDIDAAGRINGLIPGVGAGQWANAGVYMISPAVLTSLQWRAGDAVSLEQDLLPAVLANGRPCYTLPCGGVFIDIGVPEDYVRAAQLPVFKPRASGKEIQS